MLLAVGTLVVLSGSPAGAAVASDQTASRESHADASADLKPKWQLPAPGAENVDVRYIVSLENFQSATPPPTSETPNPTPQTTTTRQTIELVRRAVPNPPEEKDVATTLLMRYERVKVHISVGTDAGESLEIDTALPPEKDGDRDLGDSIRNTINKPFTLMFDAEGRLIRVEGNKFTRGNVPTAQSVAGDDIFRSLFEPMYGLPGKPARVAVGSNWPGSIRFIAGHLGTIVTDVTGTLHSVAGRLADISFTGTPTIASAIGPMAVRTEGVSGSYTAKAKWDVTAGRLANFSSVRVLDYTIDGKAGKAKVQTKLTTSIDEAPEPPPQKTP